MNIKILSKIILPVLFVILLGGSLFAQGDMIVTIVGASPLSDTQSAPASVTLTYSHNIFGDVEILLDGYTVSTTYHGSSGTYSYTYNNLSAGTHSLGVYVSTPWGDSDSKSTSYVVNNALPTASITSITPSSAIEGTNVLFKGTGSDPDGGSITAYSWNSSIDGFLSSSSKFDITYLSVGTHTIYFKVKDDEGAWSANATGSVTVTVPAPTVTITSVNPESNTQVAPLNVTVYYTAGANGNVTYLLDESSVGGPVNVNAGQNQYTFNNLQVGTHTLEVFIQNSAGSQIAGVNNYVVGLQPDITITNLTVQYLPAPVNEPEQNITIYYTINYTGDVSFQKNNVDYGQPVAQQPGNYSYTFTNLTIGSYELKAVLSNQFGSDSDSRTHIINTPPPPTILINSVDPVSGTGVQFVNATLLCTTDQPGDVTFMLDESVVKTLPNAAAGQHQYTFNNLQAGSHILEVTITNLNGSRIAAVNTLRCRFAAGYYYYKFNSTRSSCPGK